jgi:hypothetical protein
LKKKTFRRLRIFFSKKDIARTVEYAISFVGIFTINAFFRFQPLFSFQTDVAPPLLKRSSKSKMRFTENGEGVGQGFAAAIPPFQ